MEADRIVWTRRTDPVRKEWDRMQGWSWMAALTLVAATVGATAPATHAADPTPIKQKVKLQLRLDGIVAKEGAEVTIKPGHPGCKFKAVTKTVKGDCTVPLDVFDVETVTADRDCSFSITLKEPGQPDKTVRRSIQIEPNVEGKPAKSQTLSCFVTSKSLSTPVAEKSDSTDEAKRKK